MLMKHIERKRYLDRLMNVRGTPDIKIITGVRRCGKSVLLRDFMTAVEDEEEGSVLFIDFNDIAFEALKDYHRLFDYIEARGRRAGRNCLCIDEVQECVGFERVIDSLHNGGEYDIYLTGSNAFLLSSDLATLFTGRYLEINIFPFSFAEYCLYYEGGEELFDDYVLRGGMAGSFAYADEEDRRTYLQGVYNTIAERDLAARYRIKNIPMVRRIMDFLMDNTGNLTSSASISKALQERGGDANHVTVGNYIDYLCNAFLFYKAQRFDLKGKKYLSSGSKYYLCDTGFCFAMQGERNMDFGRVYENIVYLELRRRGYEVYVGKLYEKEVDFVAKRGGELFYIQVADDISRQETMTRETRPLLAIRDAHPKWLLARTRPGVYSFEGIIVKDIAAWLLDGQNAPIS